MAKTRRSNRKCWNRKLRGGNVNKTLKPIHSKNISIPILKPVSATLLMKEKNVSPSMSATILPSSTLVHINNYKGAIPEQLTIVSAPRPLSPTFAEGKTRKNRKNRKN